MKKLNLDEWKKKNPPLGGSGKLNDFINEIQLLRKENYSVSQIQDYLLKTREINVSTKTIYRSLKKENSNSPEVKKEQLKKTQEKDTGVKDIAEYLDSLH